MKNKLLYTGTMVILSAGFYLLGSFTHQPTPVPINSDLQASNSDPRQFYSSFTDGLCPFVNTPDTEVCITRLATSTLAEADILANKLTQSSPENKENQFEVIYYDSLHANVQSAQKARDTYFDAVCGLNGLISYGGTGMGSDIEACRYYHAQLYLNLLRKLDN